MNENLKITRFYYFNVTNYEEVERTRGNVKPLVSEVGPYSFVQRQGSMY